MHRVFKAPAERLYRAFLDRDAVVKWLAPRGFTAQVHALDARVGGTYRTSFTNFASGEVHSFGGEYLVLEPDRRIVYNDRFDAPELAGEMETTIELREVSCGTDVEVVQRGIPEMIPVEMCYLGWQESFEQLAQLVETAP